MDMDGIESGTQFEDVIIRAIDQSKIVLFLLSKHSMESDWTKDEIRYALNTHKKVLPVNIDGSEPQGWFLFKLAGNDVIDNSDRNQREKMFNDLANWINAPRRILTHKEPNFYKFCCYLQIAVFVPLLLVACSLFFSGGVSKHTPALLSNSMLTISLLGTLVCSCLVVFKKMKLPFLALCALSVVEILLVCLLAKQIVQYGITGPYIPYKLLGQRHLGGFVQRYPVKSFYFMQLFALLHIGLMCAVVFAKIKGKSLWEQLTPSKLVDCKRLRQKAHYLLLAGSVIMFILVVFLRQEWLVILSAFCFVAMAGAMGVGYYRPRLVGVRTRKSVLKYGLVPCVVLLMSTVAGYFLLDQKSILPKSEDTLLAVDMGLSSGTLWANKNIGASAVEDHGEYYAWGEIKTKGDYSQGRYSESNKPKAKLSSAQFDVATAVLGAAWSMPTESQFNELINECQWTRKKRGNIIGFEVVGPNGNSIFLPLTGYICSTKAEYLSQFGYYWTSQRNTVSPRFARALRIPDSLDMPGMRNGFLYYGRSVRAVTHK